ncbi:CoA-transferase family III domain-containing protein [Geopyxis carbonaria]|nr:CoA-transferase family III domain-containing protein [Geopyxis carbonaria]
MFLNCKRLLHNLHLKKCFTTSVDQSKLPLNGVKVLDMTRVLAGPYCTQILGDLGAEVIKLEHPQNGDDTRAWGPPYALDANGEERESAYFLCVRNKQSLAVSFKEHTGQSIIQQLARRADILVENYLPGTLAKYKLSYTDLSLQNPRLIYASITGYGQTGPYRNRAGYDVMVEAEFGLMHITGEKDRPPVKVGVAVTDMTTGLYASNSIMAALLARAQTGKGQHLDIALSDCQVATLANIASSVLISGEPDSGRHGTAHPSIVPYESFPTKDGNILLGGGNDRLYGILCETIGEPLWASDSRFKTNALRVEHRHTLVPMIADKIKMKTTKQWLGIFNNSGMPYAPINDIQTTLSHEQVVARDMVQTVKHKSCGSIKLINTPVKFSQSTPGIRTPPPQLGEHTDEILENILGMNGDKIAELKLAGIIA